MHATVNADRDLHSGVFDVDDTSFLPKVCARYHVNYHRGKENSVSKLWGTIQYSRNVENFVMLARIQKRKYQII